MQRFLGMSAAAVLLTSFASVALTQAAISYPTRLVEGGGGTATVARSESYPPPEANLVADDTLDLREKQAIQLGLYHAPDEELPHVMPSCSSGECHWRNFNSLAVCAAVADVSDKLAVSSETEPSALGVNLGSGIDGPVCNASLPNGVFLIGSPGTCNLNMSAPSPVETGQDSFLLPAAAASLAFSNLDARVSSAVANFFVVYTGQTANSGQQQAGSFHAAEVLLHFCVNTYQVSTSRGVSVSVKVNSSTTLSPSAAASEEQTQGISPERGSPQPSQALYSFLDDREYSVQRDGMRLLNNYLRSVFSGTYSSRYGPRIAGSTAAANTLGVAMLRKKGLEASEATLPGSTSDTAAAIMNIMDNLATSLTNSIRAMGTTEYGFASVSESYVCIRWPWLAFLATQVTISAMFVLGIVVQTAVWKVVVLKSSATATLLALPADVKASFERNRPDTMVSGGTRGAQSITFRFKSRDQGWALVFGRGEEDLASV
ncbi:hypothetical protein B0T24DRAFT_59685 [Lasiosphaeria ovina]|uniref:Uncharacterized protein n=1 Tax=Lasiosphaeria ovina TaxID=92902 RepID=A0AAE0NLE9_9PEZI|nr:hypothetical protein B0T24DRAFT_59685 [Lasiosphaeria ovina]